METDLIQYTGPDKRKKYALTDVGADLKPIIAAIGLYGSRHLKGSMEYMNKQMALPKKNLSKLNLKRNF